MGKLQHQITQVTIDTLMGVREGVGMMRIEEFAKYIEQLLAAKEAGIKTEDIPMPLLTDRVEQGVQAAMTAATSTNVEGGIEWEFIALKGGYGSDNQSAVNVQVNMQFMSVGAVDLEKIQAYTSQEWQNLLNVLEPYRKVGAPQLPMEP